MNSGSLEDQTIMWGYSPNFNMKKQHNSQFSSDSAIRQFNLGDSDLKEKKQLLQEKVKMLQDRKDHPFGAEEAIALFDILQARLENFDQDEESMPHFKTLKKFQERDVAAKQLFFQYLENIDSIDVVEGEDMLTAFEFVTSLFDNYLCRLIQVKDYVDRSEQSFQNQVLAKTVADVKLQHEIVNKNAQAEKIE